MRWENVALTATLTIHKFTKKFPSFKLLQNHTYTLVVSSIYQPLQKEGNLFSQAAKTITTEHPHVKKLFSAYYFLKLCIPQYDI